MQDGAGEGLSVRGVAKRFGAKQVLRGVSLDARPGRVTALVGQNGAGKSTLFRILMGLVVADAGSASVDGREVLGLPLHRKRVAGLGYLPQEGGSFPSLSAAENLLAVLELLGVPRAGRRGRLAELLRTTGLEEAAERPYAVLSGGEQRRLEIAKVLAAAPRVMLLDEPFSGLDPRVVEELSALLVRLAAGGAAVLLTDHNVHMTLSFVDHAYVLAGGAILCQGAPAEVAVHPDARDLYFGGSFRLP